MKRKAVAFEALHACRAYTDESRQIWNLTVNVTEIPQNLPYGPNARNADLKAKPAKAMLATLKEDPENFIYFNNGIMVVAEDIEAKRVEGGNFKIRLTYRDQSNEDDEDFLGHGVLNGGHTYKSISHALFGKHKRGENYPNIANAHVQLSVATGIKEDDISSISRARNLSKPVPDYALRNLAGDWGKIESHLPGKYRKNIIFKPSEFDDDPDAYPTYDVTDLVRRLALLNNKLFPWREDKHPTKAYTSLGALVRSWKDEDYNEVLHLLPDILWLEEKIADAHLKVNGKSSSGGKIVITKVSSCSTKSTKLITGKSIPITIGPIFFMPVLAAFRVLIKEGQWIEPVDQLWDEWGEKLVDKLWDTYKSDGKSSAISFARSKSTWSTLTNLVMTKFVQI